jgi:glycosyltransferase involved in cell wall biosynthesis
VPPQANRKLYVHVQRFPKGQMKFYGKAARLQTVSTVIRNAICQEAPKLAERVRVIPNFVSSGNPPEAMQKRGNCILYVGRIHPEKGVHLLIEAFERLLSTGLSNWKLRLVGPWDVTLGGGGDSYYQNLRKKAARIENAVEWVGPEFDGEKLRSHYREASLFVYPSLAGRGEASPLAPLEAMSEGCPPVVSSLECFRDYVNPETNGWVFGEQPPDGVSNLTELLKRIIKDSHLVQQVRERASVTAQQFAMPRIADLYLSDFEEVARS